MIILLLLIILGSLLLLLIPVNGLTHQIMTKTTYVFGTKKKFNLFIFYFDYILIGLVFAFLFYDLLIIITSLLDYFNRIYTETYSIYEILSNMVSTSDNSSSHNTNVQITHTDAGWSNSIRQLFIYGTGAFRLSLLRAGGSPSQKAFVIATTVLSDTASKAINNAINDPSYVKNHITNWKQIWTDKNTVEIHVDNDSETMNKINEVTKNFMGDGVDDFYEKLMNNIIEILNPVLSPVSVDYSNILLAEQIYGLSIILFILSVLIIFLLVAFMFNVLILIYSDKLMNLFTNKYIKWYIAFNKKIIGIELFFLGGSILYFMYMLSYGIHFIATHPIPIN